MLLPNINYIPISNDWNLLGMGAIEMSIMHYFLQNRWQGKKLDPVPYSLIMDRKEFTHWFPWFKFFIPGQKDLNFVGFGCL